MERRDTSGYIYLGTALRYLVGAQAGYRVFGDSYVLENLNELSAILEKWEFHVTNRVAGELWDMQKAWVVELAEHENEEGWAEQRLLTDKEQRTLASAAMTTRATALAEARGKIAFIATDKRFTVAKLLDDIGSLMGSDVFDELPDLAQYDLKEGGRALAFELPTAAAFHFLRATEAVLRDFYSAVVKRNRIKEPRMWAAMVNDMRGKRNAPSGLLLNNLDSLRSNFRNPTQHPEMVYEMDEAQDLLSLAIDSINRMVKHKRSLA